MKDLCDVFAANTEFRSEHLKELKRVLVPKNIAFFRKHMGVYTVQSALDWDLEGGAIHVVIFHRNGYEEDDGLQLVITEHCLDENSESCVDSVWTEDGATILWNRKR